MSAESGSGEDAAPRGGDESEDSGSDSSDEEEPRAAGADASLLDGSDESEEEGGDVLGDALGEGSDEEGELAIERDARALAVEDEAEAADAEAEMRRHATEGAATFELPTEEELEMEDEQPPDLDMLKQCVRRRRLGARGMGKGGMEADCWRAPVPRCVCVCVYGGADCGVACVRAQASAGRD